jgi:hypothetical protein
MASDELDGPGFARLLREHAIASKVLSKDEALVAARLCEVAKAFLLSKAKGIVRAAGDRAVLVTYGSDGTPALTFETTSCSITSQHSTVRKAGHSVEFLVERAFLRTTSPTGSPILACVLRDAVPLVHGKGGWAVFGCASRFFPVMRDLEHKGICILHSGFDRALQSSLDRKMQQRQSLYYEVKYGPDRSGEPALLELKDWVLSTGCTAHDIHNGLKWSLHWLAPNPTDILHQLHVAMQSLRNGYDLVHGHLGRFVSQHLSFDPEPHNKLLVYRYWTALGVEVDAAEILSELNLRWDGSRLQVSALHQGADDLFEKLTMTMLVVFKFKKFTASRWVTIGESSRALVAALGLGLAGLVKMIRADPEASDYYIHGFGFLDDASLRWATLASVSSWLPDSVLMSLLQDDRLARRAKEVVGVMKQELDWIGQLEPFIWERLAAPLLNTSPKLLRSQAMYSCLISAGFVARRAIAVVRSYPWRLCEGDVEGNLRQLQREDSSPSEDQTTTKIHRLLQLGFPIHMLAEGIDLLSHVHWTTTSIEQGHGSMALVHRLHRYYSAQQLCQRAFIHAIRALAADPDDDPAARSVRALDKKLVQLSRRQPQRITGRHIFLGDCQEALHTHTSLSKRGKLQVAR